MLEIAQRRPKQTRFFGGKLQLLRNDAIPLLPPELVWEIATHLQRSFQLRSLAKLNRTCKTVREVTLPVLYETVVWTVRHRRMWEPSRGKKKRTNPRLKYIKYMFLQACLFIELQNYVKQPGETLPLDSLGEMFPQLVFITLTAEPEQYDFGENGEGLWSVDCHVLLYGTTTPIELVRCSYTRPPALKVLDDMPILLQQWDATNNDDSSDISQSEMAAEPKDIYEDQIKGLTLHKNARLITSEQFPHAALLKPMRGGWRVNAFRDFRGEYFCAPRLDIRHLSCREALDETLQSCAWLLQASNSQRCHAAARVHCRSEVVMPLFKTYLTQNAFEFFITLCDEVDVSTFVALAESVASFLCSVPEQAKLASEDPGDYPFIEIQAGSPDDEEEFFENNHRASFTLHIEEAIQPPRCYFLLSVNARSHSRDDPARRTQVQYDRSYYLGDAPPQ